MKIYGIRIPEGAQVTEQGRHVAVAYGELTGHAHRVDGEAAIVEHDGLRWLVLERPSTIDHEEHGLQQLTARIYAIDPQQELSLAGEWQQVLD